MKKLLFFIGLYFQLQNTFCQFPYWQQQTNYTIDVSLNDAEHTLDGFSKIEYTNNSPDTLYFIWFHLWPNAYKNDRTAFSEQLLLNGRTDFYFSAREQKGYINRLDFRMDGVEAAMEDHPIYIDIVKVRLPHPLVPGGATTLTTPFHVQLPYNFSGSGHIGQSYQVTNWFPRPAVYDQKGWHEMPYLDQGESYNEWGNFKVNITLPANYLVAAPGEMQNSEETKWMETQSAKNKSASTEKSAGLKKSVAPARKYNFKKSPKTNSSMASGIPASAKETKTLVFIANNRNDFGWYADKRFAMMTDTVQLSSGKIIKENYFYLPEHIKYPAKSMALIKNALRFYSNALGEYPHTSLFVADTERDFFAPAQSSLFTVSNYRIEKNIADHWFSGMAAPDARRFPWMEKGLATYYAERFRQQYFRNEHPDAKAGSFDKKRSDDPGKTAVMVVTREKTDQPVATAADHFSAINYQVIAGAKTTIWLKHLATTMGLKEFDTAMKRYFADWQFRHPYPADLQSELEKASGKDQKDAFLLLDHKGEIVPFDHPRKLKPAFLFSQKNTDKNDYINFAPAIGYNRYDQVMIGAAIHNINLPPDHFQFYFIPLFATNSKQLNGLGNISYSFYPDTHFQKIEMSIGGAKFQTNAATDTSDHKLFEGFYKITPAIRFVFKNKSPLSSIEKWIELKTFLIGEKTFDPHYLLRLSDSTNHPASLDHSFRYLNQLSFMITDYRVLYPYDLLLQLQQGSQFYRLNATANYFLNYSKGGGASVRVFAAKFGYLGANRSPFDTYVYQPKLTATRGDEDYTYSNYFIGRNEFTGLESQQIMIRDGGFKLRTDLFQDLQGRSDNWVAALNLTTTLPSSLVPAIIPLKIFADLGSYSGGWKSNGPTGKFLYDGGLQLSLFKNILNIYAPLIYSSDFGNVLKTVPQENTFWKKVSFSIDIQNINFRKIFRNTPF